MMNFFRKPTGTRPPIPSVLDAVCAGFNAPKRVLFLEDDLLFRGFVEDYAAKMFNVEFVVASRVSEARAILASEEVDAAILDVRVANGDGIVLYREIVEHWPDVQVIFLTGLDSNEVRQRIEEVGPARVYLKDSIGRHSFLDLLFVHLRINRRVAV